MEFSSITDSVESANDEPLQPVDLSSVSLAEAPVPVRRSPDDAAIRAREPWNFRLFMLETCIQRWSWVFKTESTIIPALALLLGASEFVLGFFPMISRCCGFLPQVVAAPWVDGLARKKWFLVLFNLLFASVWLVAGVLLLSVDVEPVHHVSAGDGDFSAVWVLWVFMGLYALGWCCFSLRNVMRSATVGKLVRAQRRGRMFGIGMASGGIGAALLSWFVIRPVLVSSGSTLSPFGWLFLAVGSGFACMSLLLLFLREPAVAGRVRKETMWSHLKHAAGLLRRHRNFRCAVLLQFSFLCSFTMMMFYIAHVKSLVPRVEFMEWTGIFLTVQVSAQVVFAPLMGQLADRYGNRLALRCLAVITILWPLSAVVAAPWVASNPLAYVPVYVLTGALLPSHFIANNYLLEIAPEGQQARYIGTASAFMSLAVVIPGVAGKVIQWIGFETVFTCVSATMVLALLLAMRLEEPRRMSDV